MMLTDLAAACRKSGLKVVEADGWRSRGHDQFNSIETIVCHHTAGPKGGGNYPSYNTVLYGRPGLSGPLAQLGLGRDGTVYVFAAGVAWHAGTVKSSSYDNWHAIGIEAEHDGVSPWPKKQVEAYARLCAALAEHYNVKQTHVLGHKEVCSPPGRKIDPNFSMPAFRKKVWHFRKNPKSGGVKVRKPKYWRKHYPPKGTFVVGNHSSASTWLGRRLVKQGYGRFYKVGPGPNYSKTDQRALVAFKRKHRFGKNGAMTRATWKALNRKAGHARPPRFWAKVVPPKGTFWVGNEHTAVTMLGRRLHVHGHKRATLGPKYTKDTQAALVAFKRKHKLGKGAKMTPKVWRHLNRRPKKSKPKHRRTPTLDKALKYVRSGLRYARKAKLDRRSKELAEINKHLTRVRGQVRKGKIR